MKDGKYFCFWFQFQFRVNIIRVSESGLGWVVVLMMFISRTWGWGHSCSTALSVLQSDMTLSLPFSLPLYLSTSFHCLVSCGRCLVCSYKFFWETGKKILPDKQDRYQIVPNFSKYARKTEICLHLDLHLAVPRNLLTCSSFMFILNTQNNKSMKGKQWT